MSQVQSFSFSAREQSAGERQDHASGEEEEKKPQSVEDASQKQKNNHILCAFPEHLTLCVKKK